MFDILCEFSRTHCLTICALLVPANLLATLQTLIFTALGLSALSVRLMGGIASLYALVMVFHVLTWFLIGVVMPPTYILLGLATLCLGINAWAIAHSPSMVQLFRQARLPV
ncbi:hypothetical protein [Phormidium sp. CCY1219]|uniref:hypothetical protein n=1 Tax=Phormidium sp. CCY1219 TaxID=2886104 RepID=UPI002D1F1D7A|nr:hypothetical protein [Phormidium sp. CCY1219]MEB3831697.1 hypothetical protein [Phormidium sp. CCY1219]